MEADTSASAQLGGPRLKVANQHRSRQPQKRTIEPDLARQRRALHRRRCDVPRVVAAATAGGGPTLPVRPHLVRYRTRLYRAQAGRRWISFGTRARATIGGVDLLGLRQVDQDLEGAQARTRGGARRRRRGRRCGWWRAVRPSTLPWWTVNGVKKARPLWPVAVLVVVPGEELAAEGEGLGEGREAVGEVRAVLEVLEEGLGMWVVCALLRHTHCRMKVPAGQRS